MARKFKELEDRMPPDSRARVKEEVQTRIAEIEELRLRQLRDAREMTQQELAAALGLAQSEISRIEQREDMHVSTLAGYIKAIGGDLTILVTFPDGKTVKVTQFDGAV